MHLNRDHRHPDFEPLFSRSDVTDDVNELVPLVTGEIARQRRVIEASCPEIAIGKQCDRPYECPFKSRCWPERSMHDIGELHGSWHIVAHLRARGYEHIRDIPETESLLPIAARQRRAIIRGEQTNACRESS